MPLQFCGKTDVIQVMACLDSGSDNIIMSERLAEGLGLCVRQPHDSTKSFILPNGETVAAVGEVRAHLSMAVRSPPEVSLPECTFHVFRSLAVPVIIGLELLQQFETATRYTVRMMEYSLPIPRPLRTKGYGVAKKDLVCRLGEHKGLATLDTGSDFDLVSLDFARSGEFNILPAQVKVQFADCSIGYTSGFIQASLSIGKLDNQHDFTSGEVSQIFEFHVLDNLTTDIILGQETIESLDIFNKHADSIISGTPHPGQSHVRIIRHVGTVENFCSRAWNKLDNKARSKTHDAVAGTSFDASPVLILMRYAVRCSNWQTKLMRTPDLTTATQRENARREATQSQPDIDHRPTETVAEKVEVQGQRSRDADASGGSTTGDPILELDHIGDLHLNDCHESTGSASFSSGLAGKSSTSSNVPGPAACLPEPRVRASIDGLKSDISSGLQAAYLCAFSGCTAAPFQTQHLLDCHKKVHLRSRP